MRTATDGTVFGAAGRSSSSTRRTIAALTPLTMAVACRASGSVTPRSISTESGGLVASILAATCSAVSGRRRSATTCSLKGTLRISSM